MPISARPGSTRLSPIYQQSGNFITFALLFNPNRSSDFGEIARLCHAACFPPSRRRSGLRRGVARNRMRTEAGKMPGSLIFPIRNGHGVSDDRFGLNPNRSSDFGEIARLCHAACFSSSRRRSGLRRGVARNWMRAEAGKMPGSLIFPIRNGHGVSNDRFGLNPGTEPSQTVVTS